MIMARRKVVTTEMMTVKREAPKTPFLGWGYEARRKLTTRAKSPRLLKYRSCVAGEMSGKSGTLREIQEAFKSAAAKCKGMI
jgi:hypothetical protein